MRNIFNTLLLALLLFALGCQENGTKVVKISPSDGNATQLIRSAVESIASCREVIIELEEGLYRLDPELAFEKYLPITNHGNGSKKIAFPLSNHNRVVIEGNGATLLFHGQMMPFLFENCQNIEVRNLTIDWDIPFTFLAEVIDTDAKEGWRIVRPRTSEDGFSWTLERGKILYPNIDGFNYSCLGSTLAFDAQTKRPVAGIVDLHSEPERVEQLDNGDLKIYEHLRQMPPIGSLLSSKGDREHDRYAPAFDFKECDNISLEGVTIHHALGMGFLFERSEDITIRDCRIGLSKDSKRVISSTADATHFANCKGQILIDGCKFENMLDDGTNVHGTYVEVTDIVDANTLRVAFRHYEQLGFKFAEQGDQMWFIIKPSPERASTGVVKSVQTINETITEISFEQPLPENLSCGDILENRTWNPEFTMKNCYIANHRARSIVLKTPLKTVIKDNYFSSMMSGVLFRGETKFWYESGAVNDVLIEGNTFENGADCGTTHAALYITPVLGSNFDSSATYDRNIRFINNSIKGANPRVIIADRVEGLQVEGNKITRNNDYKATFADAPIFELRNTSDVTISGNSYLGDVPANILEADDRSKSSLNMLNNKGL